MPTAAAELRKATSPAHIDQGCMSWQTRLEGAGGTDIVEEGLEQDEHEEHPEHFGAALNHSREGGLEGQAAHQAYHDRGRHHDQDGVAGAGAHHQAVAQHNGHHQQEGQGGALAAGIRDKGGSVLPPTPHRPPAPRSSAGCGRP